MCVCVCVCVCVRARGVIHMGSGWGRGCPPLCPDMQWGHRLPCPATNTVWRIAFRDTPVPSAWERGQCRAMARGDSLVWGLCPAGEAEGATKSGQALGAPLCSHPRTHPHTHACMHVTQRTNTCVTDKTKIFSRPKIMLQKLHAMRAGFGRPSLHSRMLVPCIRALDSRSVVVRENAQAARASEGWTRLDSLDHGLSEQDPAHSVRCLSPRTSCGP